MNYRMNRVKILSLIIMEYTTNKQKTTHTPLLFNKKTLQRWHRRRVQDYWLVGSLAIHPQHKEVLLRTFLRESQAAVTMSKRRREGKGGNRSNDLFSGLLAKHSKHKRRRRDPVQRASNVGKREEAAKSRRRAVRVCTGKAATKNSI